MTWYIRPVVAAYTPPDVEHYSQFYDLRRILEADFIQLLPPFVLSSPPLTYLSREGARKIFYHVHAALIS